MSHERSVSSFVKSYSNLGINLFFEGCKVNVGILEIHKHCLSKTLSVDTKKTSGLRETAEILRGDLPLSNIRISYFY